MKTKKYHTVGTVPKYKYTILSEQFQNKDQHVVLSSFNHMLTEDIFINIK
jgi:hypothetical protein